MVAVTTESAVDARPLYTFLGHAPSWTRANMYVQSSGIALSTVTRCGVWSDDVVVAMHGRRNPSGQTCNAVRWYHPPPGLVRVPMQGLPRIIELTFGSNHLFSTRDRQIAITGDHS